MWKKLIPIVALAPLLGGCVVAAEYAPPAYGYYAPAPAYRPYYAPRYYGYHRPRPYAYGYGYGPRGHWRRW